MSKQRKPTNLLEAVRYFSDLDVANEFVANLRWPDGPVCPRCEGREYSYLKTRRLWKCKSCKKQYSVKVGTIFEDSPLGLDKWLPAVWLAANSKNGISSHELARSLGVTQKSAWFMLHRIRLAMQTGSFVKFSGPVEVDETYIGGLARNMHKHKRAEKIKARGVKDKTAIVGAIERGGKLRARVVGRANVESMQGLIRDEVEEGATVYTDSHPAYVSLKHAFNHRTVDHAVQYVDGNVHTNAIENFWTLLKRGLNGTYVSVEPFHLFRYLDERVFTFNERGSNDRERFEKVLDMAANRRLTYAELTGHA